MKCGKCGYPEVETLGATPIENSMDVTINTLCPNCRQENSYRSKQEPSKYMDGKA
jgi:hypothetical protein